MLRDSSQRVFLPKGTCHKWLHMQTPVDSGGMKTTSWVCTKITRIRVRIKLGIVKMKELKVMLRIRSSSSREAHGHTHSVRTSQRVSMYCHSHSSCQTISQERLTWRTGKILPNHRLRSVMSSPPTLMVKKATKQNYTESIWVKSMSLK